MTRKRAKLFCAASLASCAVIFGNTIAFAQDLSGSLPTRQQIEIPTTADLGARQVRVADERPLKTTCPFEASSLAVQIHRLRFVGADGAALPQSLGAIVSQVKPPSGSQPLSSLCDFRDAAAELLWRAGYVASVEIPPQEITGSEAILQVVPARIVDVHLVGSPGPYRETLNARIAQLKQLTPFNRFRAERILLLAGDVPGLDVALNLRPAGGEPGAVVGELAIRYVPWLALANVQNHGSRHIGRESGNARLEYYGLTGLSDRTFLGASGTFDLREQLVVQGGHYFGDQWGNTFGARASYSWSRPDIGLLDLRSRSLIAGIDATAPLIRSLRAGANVGVGFELLEQRVRLHFEDGDLPLNRDKLRVAYARIAGNLRGPAFTAGDLYGIGGSLELRQGLDILGATKRGEFSEEGFTPSRMDGDPAATVLRGGFESSLSLGQLFSVGATVQGQWASAPLLSLEEFSVGSLTIGRGYDPGITAGDHALGIRVEPRLQLPLNLKAGAQAFGFFDAVRIWNEDSFSTEASRRLRSWGGGLRVALPGHLSLEALYARPQDKGLSTDGRRASDRFLISVTTQFSPAAR